MTEEQIKKDAERYASVYYHPYDSENNPQYLIVSEDSFIAGAHSRDEEIEQLRKALSSAQQAMAELAEIARNPWISVEERMPEITYPSLGESDFVFVHVVNKDTGNEWIELTAKYNERIHDWQTNDFTWVYNRNGVVTHWMPIPQIEKGE